jgi:hypothetical protein
MQTVLYQIASPFKGEVRWGMGYSAERNSLLIHPHPIPPLEREGVWRLYQLLDYW